MRLPYFGGLWEQEPFVGSRQHSAVAGKCKTQTQKTKQPHIRKTQHINQKHNRKSKKHNTSTKPYDTFAQDT